MTKEPEERNNKPKPIWTEGHKICKSLKEGSVSSDGLSPISYRGLKKRWKMSETGV